MASPQANSLKKPMYYSLFISTRNTQIKFDDQSRIEFQFEFTCNVADLMSLCNKQLKEPKDAKQKPPEQTF